MVAKYEILAVRYGVFHSMRSNQFYRYQSYSESDSPIQMDFYFWIARRGDEIILIDTGFHPDAVLQRKGRECLIPPMDAIAKLGILPEQVSKIVVTHFHYDHIGNLSFFPNARLVVQQREFDFWMGKHGNKTAVASTVERRELEFLKRARDEDRVDFLDGGGVIVPGISVQLVGGHCPGQQIVVIDAKAPIVLASDALHFYEEMQRDMPFEVFTDLPGMYETYDLLRGLQDEQGAVIVAGHDPRVMEMFPTVPGHEGLAVLVSEGSGL